MASLGAVAVGADADEPLTCERQDATSSYPISQSIPEAHPVWAPHKEGKEFARHGSKSLH